MDTECSPITVNDVLSGSHCDLLGLEFNPDLKQNSYIQSIVKDVGKRSVPFTATSVPDSCYSPPLQVPDQIENEVSLSHHLLQFL